MVILEVDFKKLKIMITIWIATTNYCSHSVTVYSALCSISQADKVRNDEFYPETDNCPGRPTSMTLLGRYFFRDVKICSALWLRN